MDTPELPPAEAAHPVQRNGLRLNRVLTVLAIAIFAVLSWQSYDTRQQMHDMRVEIAHRFADTDKNSAEAGARAKQNQEALDALQGKIGALNAAIQETQGQYATLNAMYAEFSRARDERAVTEIEQSINIAAQQLELAGNVPGALAALQNADSRLAQLDQVRFLGLRKLVTHNIEQLKALPLADASSVALRLDAIMGRIDTLPLGFEHTPIETKASAKKDEQKTADPQKADASAEQKLMSWPRHAADWTLDLLSEFWHDFRQLIRIERMDKPEAPLLSPNQSGFLRENLRLRLLSARLALMQRDSRLFAEDIRQSRQWMQKYFDTEAHPVATTLAELDKIEKSRLNLALPSLEETQIAVRNLKLGNKQH